MNTKSIISLLCMLLAVGTQTYAENNEKTPMLTVRGQATLYKPADELQLNIGVVTQGETAEKSLKLNNEKMQRIVENVSIIGVGSGEYKTGRFSIRPVYSQRPKSPPPDWQAQIIGYEVTNTIGIKTSKIGLAGGLIDSAVQAGANSIDNIRFGIKDPMMYQADVITAATQSAVAQAYALSQAANVALGKILKLSLNEAQEYSPVRKNLLFAMSSAGDGVPIEPGDVQITGSVVVVYEID